MPGKRYGADRAEAAAAWWRAKDDEERAKTVELVGLLGVPKAARAAGINAQTLRKWIRVALAPPQPKERTRRPPPESRSRWLAAAERLEPDDPESAALLREAAEVGPTAVARRRDVEPGELYRLRKEGLSAARRRQLRRIRAAVELARQGRLDQAAAVELAGRIGAAEAARRTGHCAQTLDRWTDRALEDARKREDRALGLGEFAPSNHGP